jgi:putative spermidine/putrescine transport system permease protein
MASNGAAVRDRVSLTGAGQRRAVQPNRWVALLAPALLFLLAFYYYPVLAILARSVSDPLSANHAAWENYLWLAGSEVTATVLSRTLVNSLQVVATCLLLGYPYAYTMARVSARTRAMMMGAVLLPFWTSAVVRNYAWLVLLQQNGAINFVLGALSLPTFSIVGSTVAILIGESHIMLPFMVLSLYATMAAIDRRLLDAAASLGAHPLVAFTRVYLPLTLPGIVAGSVIVFVQALGFYLTPAILGSVGSAMIAQLIVTQVAVILDWGKGGALALLLLATILAILGLGSLATRQAHVATIGRGLVEE